MIQDSEGLTAKLEEEDFCILGGVPGALAEKPGREVLRR
jgi:hypothetical protein